MSKICPCPDPPGGQIVCEDNQFGMCAYRNGKKVGGCLDIPGNIANIADAEERNLAKINWVLSEITGVDRSLDLPIDDYERDVLRSGIFRMPEGLIVARFTLPDDIDLDSAVGGMAAV